MNPLREAAQQALEAWQTATYGHPSHHKATLLAMTALRAALAQQDEPVEPAAEPSYFGLTKDHTWLSVSKEQYDKLKPQGRMACIFRSER